MLARMATYLSRWAGSEKDWDKWEELDFLVLDILELVNLGTYGWEGEEINASRYMSKETRKNIFWE